MTLVVLIQAYIEGMRYNGDCLIILPLGRVQSTVISMSVCLFVSLFVSLFVCVFVCLSVYLSVCLLA